MYLGKEVTTPDWKRTMQMRFWSKGRDVFLVRVEAPEKDLGMSTLRSGIDRTVRVPASMLAESWMGSDLTNDTSSS